MFTRGGVGWGFLISTCGLEKGSKMLLKNHDGLVKMRVPPLVSQGYVHTEITLNTKQALENGALVEGLVIRMIFASVILRGLL